MELSLTLDWNKLKADKPRFNLFNLKLNPIVASVSNLLSWPIKKTLSVGLINSKLLKLPENTMVYPAHDYNGKKHSTIGSERKNNPRLQVNSVDQYVEIMNNLKLANPKMMDVAVPANLKLGL